MYIFNYILFIKKRKISNANTGSIINVKKKWHVIEIVLYGRV